MRSPRLELARHHHIHGQMYGASGGLGLGQNLARRVGHVAFGQRLAHLNPLGHKESIGHAAADHQMIHLAHKIAQKVELGRNLSPAHHRHHRALRGAKRCLQRAQFSLHQSTGGLWQQLGNPLGRGMGPMCGGKGVVHKDIAQSRQFGRQSRIILFLTRLKARVFQQNHITLTRRHNRRAGRGADAVTAKHHLAAQRSGQRVLHMAKAHLRHNLAFGPVKMRQKHNLAAACDDVFHGGRDLVDAGGVGHPPPLHRHVDVHSAQHGFARQSHIIQRFPAHLDLQIPALFVSPFFPRISRLRQP